MTKIVFISHSGEAQTIDVEDGRSVMEGARENGIDAIDGDCGGVCACATCKVLVDPEWIDRVGLAGEDELEMIEFRGDMPANVRLSCQIEVAPELDGLVVRVPNNQDMAQFAASDTLETES